MQGFSLTIDVTAQEVSSERKRSTVSKSKGKSKSKARGATKAQTARIVARVASSDKPDSKATTTVTKAALVKVGKCKSLVTVVSAEQLATALGVTGKRLRGVLRQTDWLGNDGRYSHYAIDVSAKDGQTLVRRLSERFRVDFDKSMQALVKLATGNKALAS